MGEVDYSLQETFKSKLLKQAERHKNIAIGYSYGGKAVDAMKSHKVKSHLWMLAGVPVNGKKQKAS